MKRLLKMKKFKEFLEYYDVYIDKPMGWKDKDNEDPDDVIEITSAEDTAQEEYAAKEPNT
jgi:hypothetical protein